MIINQDAKLHPEERRGEQFSLDKQKFAQDLAWSILDRVQRQIQIGMSEEIILSLVNNEFKKHQIQKKWHETKVRIGENTLNSFGESSIHGIILRENDIYFIDMGPVIDNHEADAGNTFFVGTNCLHEKACRDVKEIFHQTALEWKLNRLSGDALFSIAKALSEKKGWILQEKTKGHRISDFPHALYHKGKLFGFQETPTPDAWVLEIQIRHPVEPFGAFYEDVLR